MSLARIGIVLAVLAVIIAGGVYLMRQAPAAPAAPAEQPLLTGQITKMEGGRILIEAKPGIMEGDKCWLKIEPNTKIYRQVGSDLKPVKAADLAVGQQVQAWASGPVMESYPCQGGAARVVIQGAP